MNKEIEDRVDRIILGYKHETYPSPVDADFAEWLLDERHKAEKEKALWKAWKGFAGVRNSARTYAALRKIKARLGLPPPKRRPIQMRIAAMAAAILALTIVGSLWLLDDKGPESIDNIRQTVVELSNVVELSAEESVVQEKLPGNSRVWLKQHSSLKYGEKIDRTHYADLTGEGLFDIQLSDSSSFVVRTQSLQVRVYGTRFNVREYPGEGYSTVTLYRGKVKVILPEETFLMEPGYLLTYIHETREVLYDLLPKGVEEQQRDDLFDFDKVELYDILKCISDFYQVDMEMGEGSYLSDKLSTRFSGSESLEETMLILQELSGEFSYEVDGGMVRIHPM
ncbi:FecR family protein [Alistipes sp. OttesenSCG-928-B03]|nr:FecR family protein [Alistipes sp. OttesenSCG-928-B03]